MLLPFIFMAIVSQAPQAATQPTMSCPPVRDLVVDGQWNFPEERLREWSVAAEIGGPGPQPYLDSAAWEPDNSDNFNIQCWYSSEDESGSMTLFLNQNSSYSSRFIRIISNISCDLARAPTWTQADFFGNKTHDYSCSPRGYAKGSATEPLCFWEPVRKGANMTLPECPVNGPST